MKNTVLVFVVAFAFCTTAMASDIAFYVGQWNTDGWYDASQFDHVETIIAETGHLFEDIKQFDDAQFDEFGAWVDENTNDGEMDIIWLNGCMPSVLYPFPNLQPDGSRAEEWLDGGNMFINVGGWFGYGSYEGGNRQEQNGDAGAANILDLSNWIILFFGDNTQMTVTPTGKECLPSLNDRAKTDRPVVLVAVEAPWEVAAIFASLGGTDDAGTEAQADPVVIHNTETGGYVAFINQAGDGPGGWIDDRGLTCAEFIGNWVCRKIGLSNEMFATAPNPKDGGHHTDTWVALSWQPGVFAVSHDIYFGDNFDDVNDGVAGTFQGNQTATSFNVGLPGSPYPNGLVLHTTYYWRIDEVEANGTAEHKGDVWSFTISVVENFETNDFTKFPWSSSGDGSWDTTRRERHSGSYGAQSGSIEDGESTTLEVSLDCVSSDINFYCKVSSESRHDHLKFKIDGVEKGAWSGEEDWFEVSFSVDEGTRTFEWTYSKNSSVSEGDDCAWIDDIVFPIGLSSHQPQPDQPQPAGIVIELTDATFDQIVLSSDIPVLVDFWAPWCGPCWTMAPVIKEIADEYAGRVKICKINVDNSPNTNTKYSIRFIPTFILFKDGQVRGRWIGVTPKEKLTAAIEEQL
jgi:thioredoxin 1